MQDRKIMILKPQQVMKWLIRLCILLSFGLMSVQLLLLMYFCSKMRYMLVAMIVKTPDNTVPILAVIPHQCFGFMLRFPVKKNNIRENSAFCQCGKLSGFLPPVPKEKQQREVWKPGSNNSGKIGDGLKLIGVWKGKREDAVWRQWAGKLEKCFSTLESPKVPRTRCYPRTIRTFSGETQIPAFSKTS